MKILIVGAYGDIGRAVCEALAPKYDLIRAGRSRGDLRVDMSDLTAVRDMYRQLGPLDAVISTAGSVHFAPLADQDDTTLMHSFHQKVIGQTNLVMAGMDCVQADGAFTLTSGFLDRVPVLSSVAAATTNAALAGFVRAAALEMPRGLRINVVSPALLDTSAIRYRALFPDPCPVSAQAVGAAYLASVTKRMTGQVLCVG